MRSVEPAELSDFERKLCDAVQGGQFAGPSDGADPADGASWEAERSVRADVLYQLATGVHHQKSAPRALRLRGARVVGELDLEACAVLCPVQFERCYFEEPMDFSEASVPALRLHECHFPGVFAFQLETRGNLEFRNSVAMGSVWLVGAHVGGQLILDGVELNEEGGGALLADSLTVAQSMFCRRGFAAQGELRLVGAHIGGDLVLESAALSNRGQTALNGEGLVVDGHMFCRERFSAQGEVRLLGAHVGGQLSFDGAHLANPEGDALMADVLTVDQSMFCRGGFVAEGELRLMGAHIGSQLSFDAATLRNPEGAALAADGLTVDQGLFFSEGFSALGDLRLSGAEVGGQLSLEGATLRKQQGKALDAEDLTVDRAMLCRRYSRKREFALPRSHIRGQLVLDGASLSNKGETALNAEGLKVGRDLLGRELSAEGELRLPGADIVGQLAFLDAKLNHRDGVVLELEGVRAAHLYLLCPEVPSGSIHLTNARVDYLHDLPDFWPTARQLDGFVYGSLEFASGAKERLKWIESSEGQYEPQVFDQLLDFYRKAGREEDARKVAVAKQRRRHRELNGPGRSLEHSAVLDDRLWLPIMASGNLATRIPHCRLGGVRLGRHDAD